MDVISDVRKIIKQVLGTENMFGLETTMANQLYLLFCGWGNVYYTDKVSRPTKFLWISWVYSSYLLAIVPVTLYFMYGRQTGDILLLTYTGLISAAVILYSVVQPALAMFRYRKDIEETILMADKILKRTLQSHTEKSRKKWDELKKTLRNVIIGLYISLLPFTFMTIVDIVFFYQDEKIKDFSYYLIPFSGLDRYASMKFYIISNIVSVCLILPVFLNGSFFIIFPLFWAAVCFNEAQRIIDVLNSLSTDVNLNTESYESIEPKFRDVLRKTIHDINVLTRMIARFRGFFEAIAGVKMPLLLYIEIAHALVTVTPGYPYTVRAKEVGIFITTISDIYIICWAGSLLQESASALCFAVYSTPWHWLKSVRKDVYILLCQTQAPIEPFALNVYPLKLPTFLRFCNFINSVVNVYRAYSGKHRAN